MNPGPADVGDNDARVELVLALGEALHRHGAPAHRLEEALGLVSARLGLDGRFFATPTSILASFGPVAAQRTSLVRVEPGEMDLEKLALLHDVTSELIDGRLDVTTARARVARILQFQSRYGALVTVLSYGLASAASAVFLGGTPVEISGALGLGIVVGVMVTLGVAVASLRRILEPLAALVTSAGATLLAHQVGGVSAYLVTLAGVISLLPGLGVTTAMTELASRHLISGTARLAGAVVHLLGLGVGVALGARVGMLLPGVEVTTESGTWPLGLLAAAVVGASVGFMVQVKAPLRDTPWIVGTGALAFAGTRVGSVALGAELGAFVGAFLVAAASNLYARALNRPATVTLVPAILLLVPGSVGFRSVFSMLEKQVVPAVDAAFTMVLVAISLVAGLLVANAAVPPRRPL
ncbi:MAG: threonine/serine exporter family protein [Myxococcota bacterium]